VGVPDRVTAALWACYAEDSSARVITACREGEAVGICGGLYLAGHRPLFCVKNFGLFESLDTLRMLAVDFGTPLLMFIGHEGRPRPGYVEELSARLGADAISHVVTAGLWTTRILDTIGVPHYGVHDGDAAAIARSAARQAAAESRPVALLGELP
jgi:sulfopyruvate decarboxylase TPP-binding subunit